MKIKRILFLTLVSVVSLMMSMFGVGFKVNNKTARASSEVSGFDINGEFMLLSENATAIKYATTEITRTIMRLTQSISLLEAFFLTRAGLETEGRGWKVCVCMCVKDMV